MSLSTELISQFVKATKDDSQVKPDTIAYGTVQLTNGKLTIQLDGASTSIPIEDSTIDTEKSLNVGNRVMVLIKNHKACIIGNLTSQSITVDGVQFELGRIDALEVDNAAIHDTLTVQNGVISDLSADYGDFKELTAEKIETAEGKIASLESTSVKAEQIEAKYATIDGLKATNGDIYNLKTIYASAERMDTTEAIIEELTAKDVDITVRLDAAEANIEDLDANVAKIDTLIFGSASGNTMHVDFANAVVALLGDAWIKSAMVESVSADKITAGDIITNNIRVMSEDGSLIISDETLQISDGTRVRVQIGKDEANDYSINVWDQNGNLMFSKGGITDAAIKEAIIRDDMVSDTANISAHKLNIDSLFEEINNSSKTIKSTKVYLDEEGQTLDVAFKSLETEVTEQGETMSAQYTSLEQSINGVSTTVAKHATQLADKADNSSVKTVSDKVTSLEQTLDGFQTTVSNTYAEKSYVDSIRVGGRNLLRSSDVLRGYSAASGITYSNTEDGYLQVVAASGNSNWFSLGIGNTHTQVEDELSEGDEFTISFTMRSQDSTYIPSVYIKPGLGYYDMEGALSPEWSTVWYSGTWKDANTINFHLGFGDRVGTYEIKNCKIERGNKPTDWTPAQEDMATAAQIASANTQIAQNSEAITLRATKTEVTQAVANIEIGSRNLIPASSFQAARNVTSTKEFELRNSWATTYINNANLISLLEPATQYTVKYDVELIERTTVPTKFDMMLGFLIYSNAHATWISLATNMPETAEIGAKKTVQHTFTTPTVWNDESLIGYSRRWTTEGSEPVGFDAFKVTNFKIEKGNKATDWTPAPEDMATAESLDTTHEIAEEANNRVTEAQSLIQQLSDSISMLVTDGNGTSLMTQTEDGWTFSTADIQTSVNNVFEGLSSLVDDVGDIDNTVDILKQAVDDLGVTAEYIRIGTYEDEPCIELGESDSDFKLIITNTRILFMEGTSVPAYINNQSLHITKAVIEEEIQQGEFVWKVRANGNMGLMWKGEV